MKFFAYTMLIAATSALNLDQVRPASDELVQMRHERDHDEDHHE